MAIVQSRLHIMGGFDNGGEDIVVFDFEGNFP